MKAEPGDSGTTRLSSRRGLIKGAALGVALPSAAALLGPVLATPARAATPAASATASATAALPDFAPVPAASFGPAVNSDGYFVGQIKGNLYWVTDSYYQAMFLTTREGVVVVDAPPTIGNNLLRAIQEVTRSLGRPSRVTHMIYSHNHADHIGGAGLFGGRVERIAHVQTRELLRRAADPNRPLPTTTFKNNLVVEVGGERLELAYHGPNHSPDNIFIYAPAYNTLMLVDVIFPGWAPFKNLAESQDIPGWIGAHETAHAYPWTTLVGGHLGRLGIRADLDVQRDYVGDLQNSVRKTLTTMDPTPFFEKYGATGNGWAIFKTYLDAAAQQAAAPVISAYLGKLAAADVFTLENASAMINSMRIDYDVLGPFGNHA
ncbi:MBL fold metallo-hydrolase [Actinacidiphila guanduensis]|jgi:glyoxylase-like metal-dependent hydrolase (beta-lactamase superfamily II)|uniref:Glyoxylase, beta-lactamase superfamily II n=1 Tax=Actinacidiphila guanduensis TaxID=310781 RepID=A0A1G9VTY6_9ACTN|nr:MBL fold metallo-hydrolase [Actinacidiphila guanduensis]SDM75476.1 Glyoxylase, beta-lactamase superfamily II [Actinacidiphila guanduensis]